MGIRGHLTRGITCDSIKTSIEEEIRAQEFDIVSAQRYAQEGRIEEWVHRYLATGDWANPGLSAGLKKEERWWYGPVEVKLDALSRAVGPEPDMEYPVDEGAWQERTRQMAESMTSPLFVPPLIVEYRGGKLCVRDGNTRHGAMSSKGWTRCWVIVW